MPSRVYSACCSDGRPSNHQNAVHRQASSQPVRNVRSASASILEYPHRLHWRWRFLPANFLSTGFRMISTTSPTVRRWCVFCVTCRTSKTARKAHICGSSRVATLCVTSAPFSQRASGSCARRGASLPTASHAHSSTTDPPWHLVRAPPLRNVPTAGLWAVHPACRLYALSMPANRYPRQVASCFSITAPDIAASFCQFHLYMGLRQRARCRAEHLRLCPSRSMD